MLNSHGNGKSANTELDSNSVMRILEREKEYASLKEKLCAGKSTLIFGPKGIGKTRLLRKLAQEDQNALYVEDANTSRSLLLGIAAALQIATGDRALPRTYADRRIRSLKGLVRKGLQSGKWRLLLDQLDRPSSAQCSLIKDLHHYGEVPLAFAAKSPHMEDVGDLQILCLNKDERIELKPLHGDVALVFAQDVAEKSGLDGSNLEDALQAIVTASDGSPGAIKRMIQMSLEEKYRSDGFIKTHVIYLDYLMKG
jgi:hypothetical protein